MKKLFIVFMFLLFILTGCNSDNVMQTNIEENEVTESVKYTLETEIIITESPTNEKNDKFEEDLLENDGELLLDIDVYVNDVLLDALVFENKNKVNQYDNLSDYVQAQPIMDYLGISYSIDSTNDKIILSSDKYVNTERTFSRVATFIEDELFISFSVFRLHTEGSMKQDDQTAMYLYTSDYERTDIPTTLEECYQMLDKQLNEDDIEFIKNSTNEDRAYMHLGLGMWIRNEWLHPTQSKITVLLYEKGVMNIDDMSAIIIEGYFRYLNGEECSLEDLIAYYYNK